MTASGCGSPRFVLLTCQSRSNGGCGAGPNCASSFDNKNRRCAMAKSEWSFKSAVALSAALKAKEVSSVELTRDAIDRIERHDGKINAICVRDFDRALEASRAADGALARGENKPLLGIPLTVKESYNVAGLPTTWG